MIKDIYVKQNGITRRAAMLHTNIDNHPNQTDLRHYIVKNGVFDFGKVDLKKNVQLHGASTGDFSSTASGAASISGYDTDCSKVSFGEMIPAGLMMASELSGGLTLAINDTTGYTDLYAEVMIKTEKINDVDGAAESGIADSTMFETIDIKMEEEERKIYGINIVGKDDLFLSMRIKFLNDNGKKSYGTGTFYIYNVWLL